MLKVDILKSNSKLAPALIFLALGGITGCNLFGGGVNNDLRMANNNFDYTDETSNERNIVQPAGTDKIVFIDKFPLPPQVLDSRAALVGKAVDVRPPQKIISEESNVVGFQDGDFALVWFFPDEDGRKISINETFQTVLRLFRKLGVAVDSIDPDLGVIQSDWVEFAEDGQVYTLNHLKEDILRYRQRYSFTVGVNKEGAPGVKIQITDNVIEDSSGMELADGLNRFEPARFSAQMANKLMWSYKQDLKTYNIIQNKDNIEIYLGRDNNNLSCWMLSTSFEETYQILLHLFLAYDIEINEYSSTKGEIKVSYDEFDPEFFEEHNFEPWALESGDYLFKLGIFNGKTSITLYDKNGQPVDQGVTVRMYSGFAQALNEQFLQRKYTKTSKNEVQQAHLKNL